MLAQAGGEGATAPLLSAKLHSSWIADVQLIPTLASVSEEANVGNAEQEGSIQAAKEAPLLLTASNDGTVALWDLSKGCEQGRHEVLPQQLSVTDALHSGGKP